jgi:phage terminase large subunit-like protein
VTLEQLREQTLKLARADELTRRRIIAGMTWQDVMQMDAHYERWVHESQQEPTSEGWRTWLLMAGRGFGKTRAGAEWIFKLAEAQPGSRIALVGATIAEARAVMVEGVSGLLAVANAHRRRLAWEPGTGRLAWPNGSQARLYSGDSPDGLRGPEHDYAWCDELAKWRLPEAAWQNLEMGLRRGTRPRSLITTTPRPLRVLQEIEKREWTAVTRGRTRDNINLDEKFIDVMTATYGGTRIGAQELDGELLSEVEGALWTREIIERARRGRENGEDYDRIVVGVDPPVSVGEHSDACGIVVAGSRGGQLFVLEDATVRGLSPEGWASRVAAAAARWDTAQVVAEANNGGALVESVLNAADSGLRVRLVHASIGKSARAEPVALRFENGKAFFAGTFPELEAELAGMIAAGGYEGPGRSPDRADAMVWAMTALGETRSGVPRVRRL